MTTITTCDHCGETIDYDDASVTLETSYNAAAIRSGARGGWFGHYHSGCWSSIAERLRAETFQSDEPPPPQWRERPMQEREQLVLDVLGDDRLTINELVGRIQSKVDPGEGRTRFFDSEIRPVVNRLYRGGDGMLDRKGERRCRGEHNGAIRYRYFRRELTGPIADLDRQFREPD